MTSNITATELFHRVAYIATATEVKPATLNKLMHETLVLTCAAGLAGTPDAIGSLFAKVDVLCKLKRIGVNDYFDIQKMRHDSNSAAPLQREELLYDCRALAVLISKVFDTDIPAELIGHIPMSRKPQPSMRHIDRRCVRCIVRAVKGYMVTVETAQDADQKMLQVDCSEPRLQYLADLLQAGTQVNLIDVAPQQGQEACQVRQVIVEPDFLIDISSLAACFTPYGHSPLVYTLKRLKEAANSQAILIGNFAGSALDDIINKGEDYDWTVTFRSNFREKALEYCTCQDLNKQTSFHLEARKQVENIQKAVDALFQSTYDRHKAILEPSFVCEQMGLQGRIDLMTTDLRLLVEQKSGKNFSLETQRSTVHGSMLTEPHYVQLLLYYECLSRNFSLPYNSIDGRLLYSKYPMPMGLPRATYFRQLIDEAIQLRNQIVTTEFNIARNGFSSIIDELDPLALRTQKVNEKLWNNYLYPQLCGVTEPLHDMDPLTHSYFCHMANFVYREQLASRLGVVEGTGNAAADLWNMPLTEKKETGNIYTNLRITNKRQSSTYNGYDIITLSVPNQGEDFLPNFRMGDVVYLYPYFEEGLPDVRRSLLFRGALTEIRSDEVTVQLSDGQQNPDIFEEAGRRNTVGNHPVAWCIEHAETGANATSALRSLHQLINDKTGKCALLLGQRNPKRNPTVRLSRNYNPSYNDIVLRAMQANDYFLLIGPPGTGKTSMALQYLVKETIAPNTEGRADGDATAPRKNVLLMAYTNRAVDEICGMLCDNGIHFLRIGNEHTCDKRFRNHLLDHALEQYSKLVEIKGKILDTQVIVGTTATMLSRTYLFDLKHFDLAIVDEASQILEPNIVGLLTRPDKFILVGDYKQLPAVVQQDASQSVVDDERLNAIGLTDCRNSLFERLIRIEQMNHRSEFVGILSRQGRMHPDIAEFPNHEFYFAERLQPVPLAHQRATSLAYTATSQDDLDRALSEHRMIFIASADCRRPDISDKVNTDEARIVADMLRRTRRFYGEQFDPAKTVGVIVPYRNQIAMIRKEIEKLGMPELENISIDTVERYQGSQRDVIIYSFTIQQRYQLEFLTANSFTEDGRVIDRKLNVALTRARKQLILTGNIPTLQKSQVFNRLIQYVKQNGAFIQEAH